MSWFNSKSDRIEMYEISTTEDYACVSVPEAHKYILVNQKTQHVEDEIDQLPSALYQMDALQGALDMLKSEGKYGDNSVT